MNRSTRLHRFVLIACAVSVGIILGGYLLYRFREFTGNLDRLLVQQLETQLGREIESGRVIVTRSGRFTIRDLRIAEGRTFESGTFFQVDRVEGQLNLLSPGLWQNEPIRALERVEFFNPQVTLVRQKTGLWNFQDLFKPRPTTGKPVRFQGLARIHNGTLTVRDYAASLPAKTLPAENALVSLDGTVDGRKPNGFEFQINGRGRQNLGAVQLSGLYDPLGKDGTISANVKGLNASYWAGYFGPPNPAATLQSGQADVQARLNLVDGKPDLKSIEGTALLSGGRLSVEALQSPLRSVRARVEAKGTSMTATAEAMLENIPLTLTGRIADLQKPVLQAQAEVGAFDVGRLPRLLTAVQPEQWPDLTGPVSVNARAIGPLNKLRITAQVRSPRLTHPRAVAQGVTGDLFYVDGKLQGIVKVEQTVGGSLTARGTYQVTGKTHPWSATGSFTGLNVAGFAPPTAPELQGRASGGFQFTGTGGTFSGRAEVDMARGSVGPFQFQQGSARFTTERGRVWNTRLSLARGAVQGFNFRALSASGRVDGDVIHLESARADAWQGTLRASGRVTTGGDLALNLNADRVRISELLDPLNQEGLTGRANFDGRLTGTGAAPILAGNIVARDGQLRGLPYNRLEGRLRATPQLLALQDTTLRTGQGLLALNGDIAIREGGVGRVNLNGRLQNVRGALLSRLDIGPGQDLTLPPALQAASLSGAFRVTGTLQNLSLDLRQTTLDLPQRSAAVTGNLILQRGRLRFDGMTVTLNRVPVNPLTEIRWNGRRVAPLDEVPPELRAAVVSGTIRLEGSPARMQIALSDTRLDLPAGSAALEGTLALGRGAGPSNLTVRLDRVPVAMMEGLRLPGMRRPLDIPAEGQGARVSGVATISGTPGNWRGGGNLNVGPMVVRGVQGEPVTVQEARTRFTLQGDRVTLEDTTLVADGQTLTGRGQFTLGGPIDFQVAGQQIPLEMLQPYLYPLATISGQGSAEVRVTGTTSDPRVRFNVSAGPLIVNDVRFTEMTGTLAWDGEQILFNDLRLERGDSLVFIPEGRYHLRQRYLDMDMRASSIDVEALFSALENAPIMRTAAGENARRYLTEFPMPRGGLVSGEVSINGPLDALVAAVELNGDALQFGGTTLNRVALDATVSPRSVRLDELIVEAPGIRLAGEGALGGAATPQPTGPVVGPDDRPVELVLRLEDTQIQRLIQLIEGIPSLRRTEVGQRILQAARTPRSPVTGTVDARLAVFGPMDSLQGQLDFNAEQLHIGTQDFEVARGSFAIDGRRLRVQNLRVEGGEAVVTARGTGAYAGPLDFELNVNNLNLQLLAPWVGLPQDVQGTVDVLRVLVTGTQEAPVLQASLDARNVGTPAYTADFITAPDIRAEGGRLHIGQLLIRKRAPELEETELQTLVYGSVPFSIVPLEVPRNGLLDLHVRFDEQNLALLPAFAPMVSEASGTLAGSLDLTGTWSRPIANGAITLKDGSVAVENLVNRFVNLNGQLLFNQERFVQIDFTGASSLGGEFLAKGTASLERFPQGPVNLQVRTTEPLELEGNNVTQAFGERFDGTLEADIGVSGTLGTPVVSGYIQASETNLTLSDKPIEAAGSPPNIFLPNPVFQNFRVVAGEDFFVRRGTFQGEINGELLVDGQYPDPRPGRNTERTDDLTVNGRFTIDRGRVRVATKTFRVQDGSLITVNYRAPDEPRIRVDIEATTTVSAYSQFDNQREQYLVTVLMTGPLDNPNVSFESDPPGLGRREILAALGYQSELQAIFRGGNEADQALRRGLAEAFTGVASVALFDPVESALTRALNLEEFSILYNFDSPLQVQFTKHLWSRFYVTYRRQLTGVGDDYMLKLYYRITPRINLSYTTDERNINTFLIEGRLRF